MQAKVKYSDVYFEIVQDIAELCNEAAGHIEACISFFCSLGPLMNSNKVYLNKHWMVQHFYTNSTWMELQRISANIHARIDLLQNAVNDSLHSMLVEYYQITLQNEKRMKDNANNASLPPIPNAPGQQPNSTNTLPQSHSTPASFSNLTHSPAPLNSSLSYNNIPQAHAPLNSSLSYNNISQTSAPPYHTALSYPNLVTQNYNQPQSINNPYNAYTNDTSGYTYQDTNNYSYAQHDNNGYYTQQTQATTNYIPAVSTPYIIPSIEGPNDLRISAPTTPIPPPISTPVPTLAPAQTQTNIPTSHLPEQTTKYTQCLKRQSKLLGALLYEQDFDGMELPTDTSKGIDALEAELADVKAKLSVLERQFEQDNADAAAIQEMVALQHRSLDLMKELYAREDAAIAAASKAQHPPLRTSSEIPIPPLRMSNEMPKYNNLALPVNIHENTAIVSIKVSGSITVVQPSSKQKFTVMTIMWAQSHDSRCTISRFLAANNNGK
jgi:hypothetical protein